MTLGQEIRGPYSTAPEPTCGSNCGLFIYYNMLQYTCKSHYSSHKYYSDSNYQPFLYVILFNALFETKYPRMPISFGSRWLSSTMLFQWSPSYCATALPTEHVRATYLFRLQVRLCGTLYLIVSMIYHRVVTFLRNYLQSKLFASYRTQCNRDASLFSSFTNPRLTLTMRLECFTVLKNEDTNVFPNCRNS